MKFERNTSYRSLRPTGRSRWDLARWRSNLGHLDLGSYSLKYCN